MSKKDILSLIFNDSQKTTKDRDDYRLNENDILFIFSYIAQDQGKFNTKKIKCAEFLTTKLPQCSHLLPNLSQQITEKLNIILSTTQSHFKGYFLSWLFTLFFKVNTCKELFFDIYFNTIKSFNFQIDDLKLKEYKTSFYYQAYPFKNFDKIFYVYDKINDKHLMQERILIILTKMENEYHFELLHFIFAIMCYKIKEKPTKFDIEQERNFFRLLYQYVFTPFNTVKTLYELIYYAFNNAIPIQNRKIFLFVLLILFTSIGHKRFNELLLLLSNNLNMTFEYFDKLDLSIMKENVSYLYTFLDASKTYQHCFECVIGDLTTCEDEESTISSSHSNQQTHNKNETILLTVIENLNIMKNLIVLFESIVKEKKNFVPVYMKIQLLIIKFFEPYREKNKVFLDKLFLSATTHTMKLSELKTYEKDHAHISSFLDFINKNIYGCSVLYYNWYILIFSKFSLFDSYKILLNFLLMDLQVDQPKLLNFVVKLPNELKKVNKYAWQTILDHFILNDSFNELTESQKVNVIKNLKNIFYYELSNTNHIPNTLLNQHSEIILFFRDKFDIFSSLFFQRTISTSDNITKHKNNMQIDIENMFDNYMNNNNNLNSNLNSNTFQRNINSIDTNDACDIKLEILSTFVLILNSFDYKDNIPHYYIKFTLDLIDQIILFSSNHNNTSLEKSNNSFMQYIQNVITFIINLYIKLIKQGEQFISHPIKVLVNGIIRHLLIKILKYSNDENTEIYYQYYISIVSTLQKNNVDLKDVSNNVIYMIKQMIYKNVDSQNFRNPLLIKSMRGLTDIDDSLLVNKHIIDLLYVLSKEDHLNMFGFYLRFLKLSEDCKDNCENVIKLITLLIKLNWIENDFSDLGVIVEKEGNLPVVRFLYEYLFDRKYQSDFNLVKSVYEKKHKYLILTYINDL